MMNDHKQHPARLSPAKALGFYCSQYLLKPHNRCVALSLDGFVDQRVLARCLEILPSRHEALRTYFSQEDDGWSRRWSPDSELTLTRVGMRGLPIANRDEEFRYCWESETRIPLDQEQAPLAHFSLFELGKWRHILVLTFHPAAATEEAVTCIIEDLAELYTALLDGRALPSPPVPATGDTTSFFGTSPPVWSARLPADFEGAQKPALANRSWQLKLSQGTVQEMLSLSEDLGLPPERILLGVFAGVLARYTGEVNFAMAWMPETTTANAPWDRLLSFNVDLEHQPSFREHVNQLHEALVTGAGCCGPLDENPGVVFSYRKAYQPKRLPQLKLFREPHQVVPAALVVTGVEDGDELSLAITYDPTRYEHRTIERLCRHIETMLHGCVVFPDQPVNQLPMLTREERLLLRALQTRGKLGDHVSLVHEVFTEVARRHPESIALADGGNPYRFDQLAHLSDQLAQYLLSMGLKTGDPVALVLRPSADLIIAALAVLKAGGVLFPISPDSTAGRMKRLVRRASVRLVLHHNRLADHLRRVDLLDVPITLQRATTEQEVGPITPADGALLRYPVMGAHIIMEHSTLLAMIQRQSMVSGVGGGEHIVYMNQLETDVWLRDLFGTWKNGGTVLLAGNQLPEPYSVPFVFQPQY